MYRRVDTLLPVQRWDLLDLDAPEGTRDPIVLHSDDGARAILIVLSPGQSLGEHQVKENAWIAVVEGEVEITAGAETIAADPAPWRASSRTSGTRSAATAARASSCSSRRGPERATTAVRTD